MLPPAAVCSKLSSYASRLPDHTISFSTTPLTPGPVPPASALGLGVPAGALKVLQVELAPPLNIRGCDPSLGTVEYSDGEYQFSWQKVRLDPGSALL